MPKRIVIVGGVAAGASAATKARRMTEDAEIVVLEAGPYVSFANCGLPYYVGGEIARRRRLFVVTDRWFQRRYNVRVCLNTTATHVDPAARTVTARQDDGSEETLAYDRLILATGAASIIPPIDGIDRPNVLTVRTVPDADAIVGFLDGPATPEGARGEPPRAVVIGGGYIGIETAEQLRRRGLHVTIVEMLPQLMAAMDPEMAAPIKTAMEQAGCDVIVNDALERIADHGARALAVTRCGREIPFDLGILAVGVRPNVQLARDAGLALGATGAIRVDRFQRTSDPAIYAAGDNSETFHRVLGRGVNIPLAGPANKAGRVAAANAALDLLGAGDDDPQRLRMPDVLGTAIVRAGETAAAVTGITETLARREGIACEVMYLPGSSHADYYPGAAPLLLKILYAPQTGRLLGAQAVGPDGADKRIDVLATAIRADMTVDDLEGLDLCYAPPYASAKDVPILAGFAAANARRGISPTMTPAELLDALAGEDPPFVLDVRSRPEWDAGHLEAACHVHVNELRGRLDEVPADRPVAIYCATGYRSYVAQRILLSAGRRDVRNVLGGLSVLDQVRLARRLAGQ